MNDPATPDSLPQVTFVRFSINHRSCATQRIVSARAIRGDGPAMARALQWCSMCKWSESPERN